MRILHAVRDQVEIAIIHGRATRVARGTHRIALCGSLSAADNACRKAGAARDRGDSAAGCPD